MQQCATGHLNIPPYFVPIGAKKQYGLYEQLNMKQIRCGDAFLCMLFPIALCIMSPTLSTNHFH